MSWAAAAAALAGDRGSPVWQRLRVSTMAAAATGFVAACAFVIGAGAVGPVAGTVLRTRWLGLLAPGEPRPWWAGAVLLAGVSGLVAIWIVVVAMVQAGLLGVRQVATLAAVWSAPLVIGPPVLSNDVFSYAAQGVLQMSEFDPYHTSPAALGQSDVLQAVDPRWRFARSPYGPVTTWLEHAAAWVTRGDLVQTVVVLRALAVV